MAEVSKRWIISYLKKLTVWKYHTQFEQSPLPQSLLLAWNAALPNLEVKDSLHITLGFGVETERMISAPLFSFLVESVHAKRHLGKVATDHRFRG